MLLFILDNFFAGKPITWYFHSSSCSCRFINSISHLNCSHSIITVWPWFFLFLYCLDEISKFIIIGSWRQQWRLRRQRRIIKNLWCFFFVKDSQFVATDPIVKLNVTSLPYNSPYMYPSHSVQED